MAEVIYSNNDLTHISNITSLDFKTSEKKNSDLFTRENELWLEYREKFHKNYVQI